MTGPPEPPVGSTVTDDRGHLWRRDDDGWLGCLACDPVDPQRWSWELILTDTADAGGPRIVEAT